jgi:hypothetical protein
VYNDDGCRKNEMKMTFVRFIIISTSIEFDTSLNRGAMMGGTLREESWLLRKLDCCLRGIEPIE